MTDRRLGFAGLALASLLLAACGGTALVDTPDAAATPDATGTPDRTIAYPPGWSLRDETPHGRIGHAAILDEGADRMIVHGGSANDTWALALSGPGAHRWSRLSPEGEYPPPLSPSAALYDPFDKRMILLVTRAADLPFVEDEAPQFWELSLEGPLRWRRLRVVGTDPGSELRGGRMVLDRAGKRAIVVGVAGTWALELEATRWTRIADGPPAVVVAPDQAPCVLDSRRDQLLVFDGQNLVWTLSLATGGWSFLDISNRTSISPAKAVLDEKNDRVVLVDGGGSGLSTLSLGTNALIGAGALPGTLRGATAVVDDERGRVLLFSGLYAAIGAQGNPGGELFATTWSLSLDKLGLEELVPAKHGADHPLAGANVVWDPQRKMVIAFGTPDTGQDQLATWGHGLAADDGWQRLPMPAAPLAGHAAAIYDPVRHEIVSFGGVQHIERDGLLRLSAAADATWESVTVVNGPAARSRHVGVYDEARRRLVTFGGWLDSYNTVPTALTETWALSLDGAGAWTRLQTTGTPPRKPVGALGVYDSPRARMIVYGGRDGQGPATGTTVYALSLGDTPTWTELAATGAAPAALERSSAFYEAARERMIVVDLPASGASVHALELATPTPRWHRYCATGLRPAGNDWASNAVLVPDGLFVSVNGAAFRFNLDTPYCD